MLGKRGVTLPLLPGSSSWQKPQPGRVMCNIDASFSSSWNRTSIGVCLRDEDGTFILAQTVSFPIKYSVDVGEALGLFHALQWFCRHAIQ